MEKSVFAKVIADPGAFRNPGHSNLGRLLPADAAALTPRPRVDGRWEFCCLSIHFFSFDWEKT